MFRKSISNTQLDIFTSPSSFLKGKALKKLSSPSEWHNLFHKEVTSRIDEEVFRPLFCDNNGTPNSSVKLLVAMMILKEAEGMSDQKLFEHCQFNLLYRQALGLFSVDDQLPVESTYYLFRKRICKYADQKGENLFENIFAQITKEQCLEFGVSGKRVRMDSKMMGSNIKWLSRYELIHETLSLFLKQAKADGELDTIEKKEQEELDELLKIQGNKVVFICTSKEVNERLRKLGVLIYKLLALFAACKTNAYVTLKKVFEEQFEIIDDNTVISRPKENISAKSIQSPHDTDCDYRNKDGNKIKGYNINVTETCDDDSAVNLITEPKVRKASESDSNLFKQDLQKSQEILPDKIEQTHADGAYHSPGNQMYCDQEGIDLHLHAIQGAKGRYRIDVSVSDEVSIFDVQEDKFVDITKTESKKDNTPRWRIKTEKAYRYFSQKDIDNALVRKKIEETPVEILQKRNNVEATIFQLGYHYPNDKTRYRGLTKHQMWANIRCLWVNFVRIKNYLTINRSGAIFLYQIYSKLYKSFTIYFLTYLNTAIFGNNHKIIKNIAF
jgi:hypothetical protein